MLINAGFNLTQNDGTEGRKSACAIVGGMVCMSDGSIKTIWKNHKGHIEATKKYGPYYFMEHGLELKL